MKKTALILIILSLILTGCIDSGLGDWAYDGLPGEYSVWRNNSRDISIGKNIDKDLAETVIESYVFEIYFNNQYICAKKVDVPENLDEEIILENPHYFIISIASGEVYGGFSVNKFKKKCQELNITIDEWISTKDLADKASY